MDFYMLQCIENLINKWKLEQVVLPIQYDLILDGGAFNGSYTLGVLMYFKELTKKNYISIQRISGTSIGSIMGMLYIADHLQYGTLLYSKFFYCFKKKGSLRILKKQIYKIISKLNDDFYLECCNRLFISYFDCKNNQQIIKGEYTSNNDLAQSIFKSSFVPYLIDDNLLYKSKYIDGLYPYIFPQTIGRKRIFVDLTHNIRNMLYVKNEINNCERIIEGMLDLHFLLFNNRSKKMCSFVDDWNIVQRYGFYTRKFYTDLFIYIIYIYINNFSSVQKNTFRKKLKDIYVQFIKLILTQFFV